MADGRKNWIYYVIPVVVVAALGAALYYARSRQAPPDEPTVAIAPMPSSTPPPVQNPIVTDVEQSAALPPLAQSDASVLDSLAGMFGRSLEPYLVPTDIVRNVVVTIDNLPRKKTAVQRWPLKATGGALATSGAEDVMLSDGNFERYAPLVKIVQNADAAQLAALYRRYYPLFQQSYVDLGYPDGYFNDRLVEVIDHLLATPDVTGPIRLTQPGVFFEFADPSLEERSAGQKLLIRMGPQNAAAIKGKLRELRQAIASQPRGAAG